MKNDFSKFCFLVLFWPKKVHKRDFFNKVLFKGKLNINKVETAITTTPRKINNKLKKENCDKKIKAQKIIVLIEVNTKDTLAFKNSHKDAVEITTAKKINNVSLKNKTREVIAIANMTALITLSLSILNLKV